MQVLTEHQFLGVVNAKFRAGAGQTRAGLF